MSVMNEKKRVALAATLDTKSQEVLHLARLLEARGIVPVFVDLGIKGAPPFSPDVTAGQVAEAGGSSLEKIRAGMDRSDALDIMGRGAAKAVSKLCDEGKIQGAIGVGGGQGGMLAAMIMRALPIGFPKLILSTTALIAGVASQYEGVNDTLVMNSVVDVSGENPILSAMFLKAAGAIAGMLAEENPMVQLGDTPRVGISMWGVTTPCVNRAREILEREGCQAYVFHATGLGGRIMEDLVAQGYLNAVLDLTLPEVSVNVAGGEYPPIPYRLTRAGEKGIPQVVSVGGVDMVRFPPPFDLPEKFRGRPYYMHNKDVMFVRSFPEENIEIAREIARKLNRAKGPVRVLLPLKGVSAVDREGEVLWNPEADEALFSTLKKELKPEIQVIQVDAHINDEIFAEKAAKELLSLLGKEEPLC